MRARHDACSAAPLPRAARSSALPGSVTARILEALTAGYLDAFLEGKGAAAPRPFASWSAKRSGGSGATSQEKECESAVAGAA